MKKVTSRAYAALLLAALVVLGMGVYIFRLLRDGGDWAAFYANDSVYTDGQLNQGTITDRNGTLLAFAGASVYGYAESSDVRKACLHVVGDVDGRIGTGALTVFRPQLIDYSFITGTTTDGGTVKLTIDADLNVAAYNALAGRSGAVLVYDYTTGEILCMVSSPSYDPNYGFDESDSSYEGAYINRTISSTFVPGSVFKIVTLAAAIENISDIYSQTFYCPGSVDINGQTVTCAGTHGTVTVEDAFAQSCNCAFAEIALQLGGDTIAEYAEKFGLTETHDLNGIETAAGSITSGGTDNANVAWEGIGQYEDLVSPYALLRLMGAIANGGTVVEPTLLAGESGGKERIMSKSTADALSQLMSYAVESHYGSGNYPGLSMHAKTGTAEFGDGTSHAWFAGFITNSDAPYAFVVLVEKGGSGYSVAAPIANTVLQQAVFG
jgi:peptidoglycan glycosyltransferase